MNLAIGFGYALVGLILIFWASPLSQRYNAWTTSSVNDTPTSTLHQLLSGEREIRRS
ncbi:MAG: hypothetical protein WBV55_04235 [Candidatus Sulfotelmatobacter sp.]